MISHELYDIVQKNKEKLNVVIDYARDYTFDYFGFKTLEKAYLIKVNDKVVERPQHMLMRVSIGIHGNDIKDIIQMYDMMSRKLFYPCDSDWGLCLYDTLFRLLYNNKSPSILS